ncbi:MAG TPA: DNA mismatch repair endonuclease MutL [Longimicrobiaceae bacterium]|nr:DNA mismatch repair endonuclease MutL [Longimicrobiaceae bacterium]
MPRRIHVLPERLANQIAAGEVVERPASVVKELVENALDAGAGRVEIALRNGGKTEIRVADDGWGMGRDDALLSLDRHATSKIRDPADLAKIRTLGFRGEALPSIASVSRLVVETAERDGDGTRVVVSGGQTQAVEGCARRRGTTVSVRSLFFNVPARAKFLRTAAAESRAISEVATTLALAHPEIAFTLESNDREILALPAAPTLAARVAGIWGAEMAEELMPVAHRDGPAALTGLIQRPHSATPGGRRAYLFVNGRPFGERLLVRAADRGYRTTIPEGVHPSLFLFLEVPDGDVDVNVHPAKAEVRFRDRAAIERLVEEGVRAALAALESTPSLGRRDPVDAVPSFSAAGHGTAYRRSDAGLRATREAPFGEPRRDAPAGGGGRTGFGGMPAPLGSTRPAPRPLEEPQMALFVSGAPAAAEGEAGEAAGAAAEPEARAAPPAMWQVHNTYILAETRTGLILVDQHSAHERVLYEELVNGIERGERASQRLLFPLTLRLSPAEYGMVQEIGGILLRAGFEVEPFGGRAVIVHGVPNPHPHFDAERCLREMIAELTEGSELVDAVRSQGQRVALSFACKGAIKAGQKLSQEEMRELFDRLFATELPYHDIHGRPTVIQLSLKELHNRFGRGGA